MPRRVFLGLLPFWAPQLPPLGISCLKSFLQRHGFDVRCEDFNVDVGLRDGFYAYTRTLRHEIPPRHLSDFPIIADHVLHRHALAFASCVVHDNAYRTLVGEIIAKLFGVSVTRDVVDRLDDLLGSMIEYIVDVFESSVAQYQPHVVGVSVFSGNLGTSLLALKSAKRLLPSCLTVMGGGIFTNDLSPESPNLARMLDRAPYLDRVVVGEGESLFLTLLSGEAPRTRVLTQAHADSSGVDIDSLPPPDFDDFSLEFYPYLASYASRSCPFRCSFCSETVMWGRYRRRRIEALVESMTEMAGRCGRKPFYMCDSLLNPVASSLAEAICKRSNDLFWDGYLRADRDVLRPENVELWRGGGMYRARLGLETGSPRMLELMDKRIDCEQVKTALYNLASAGIKTSTTWVVGHPGETEEDFEMTLNLIDEMSDEIYTAMASVFEFSLGGQVGSALWRSQHRPRRLFDSEAATQLIVEDWTLDCAPPRSTAVARVASFVEHCDGLGISNPYSLKDIVDADARWRRLHVNAVPELVSVELGNRQSLLMGSSKADEIAGFENLDF